MLGVAVIGVGQMGARHLETWDSLQQATVVAVADSDEERARRCVRRRPIAVYADWRELLGRADVDAVSIAVPSEHHAAVALDALAAGKHVLVEKPIATSVSDALRMAAAARHSERKLMVGHVERFNPAARKVAEIVAAGGLGQIYRVQAVRAGMLPGRIVDAGVALDLATHDLDVMQHVLGRDITRVYAEGTRVRHPSHEDMIACLLRFGDDGPLGLLDVNWLTPEKRRELTIVGEGGLLTAFYLTQDVWLVEPGSGSVSWGELARMRGDVEGTVVRLAMRKQEPLRLELSAFAECVIDDLPEPVDAYAGTRALVTALAVRESATHSRPVTLLDMPIAPRPPIASAGTR
jgi:UDP-N-acetylglucosamine 3-dehydrogenase